jgi:uncharacterized LabA/DUF88 family protein
MQPDTQSKRLAVFIDADNIPARFAENILKEVTKFGEPGLRRVYGDWSSSQLKGWKDSAQTLGLVPHQQTANTKGKNASDIGLVIDAMDVLHAGHFGVFVLVSSDSDFTRLASRIREQGLTVIGIGEAKAPDALKNACNRFVTIENLVEPDAKAAAPKKANLDAAQKLLIAAMEKIDQDDEWYQLGRLGQQVQADNPDFDTRTYGYSKLSALVKDMKQLETMRDSGNQLLVRRKSRRAAR